jgi:N-glycosidase YbiA
MDNTNMSINFYSEKDEYGEFSNFYPSSITVDYIEYPTSEHYYQSEKFRGKDATPLDLEYALVVGTVNTPSKSKILAGQKTGGGYPWKLALNEVIKRYRDQEVKLRDDWEDVKDNVMRLAVYVKFSTHEKLKKVLLSTEDKMLVEHTPRDSYWGDSGNGSGENMLGKILVETRFLLGGMSYYDVPHSKSNWVIPNILLASAHPREEEFDNIMQNGIDTFISLQEKNEDGSFYVNLGVKLNDFERKFKYFDKYARNVMFTRVPIPDRRVIDDDTTKELVNGLIYLIGKKRKILIHCLGGKGRTGVIVALLLKRLYGLTSEDALKLTSTTFKRRQDKGEKCKKMPQTKVQFDQVKRIEF